MHTCSLTLVEMHLGDKKLKWTSFRSYTVTPVCPVTKPTTLWRVFFFLTSQSFDLTQPPFFFIHNNQAKQNFVNVPSHAPATPHHRVSQTILTHNHKSLLSVQSLLATTAPSMQFFFTLQHFKQNLTSKLSVWEKHVTALTKLFCSSTRGRAGQRQQQASHGSFSITKTSIATSSKPIALLNNICSARYATKSSFVSARKRSSGLQLVGSRIARHSRALPHQEVPASFADISNANLSVAFQAMRKSLNLPQ